jgi:glutathione S-transferase
VRDSGHRSPPGLIAIEGGLGKAPTLVTADGRTIFESSAVIAYLLRTYDTTSQFAAADWIRDEMLTSFAGATLGPVTAIELLFDIAAKHTPWPLVYIARAVRKGVQNNFTAKEFKTTLGYLEKELGDKEWFNGEGLGRADFMLSWPMDSISQKGWINFESEYPKIAAWRKRIEGREAWKKGLEKGNGYNLNAW